MCVWVVCKPVHTQAGVDVCMSVIAFIVFFFIWRLVKEKSSTVEMHVSLDFSRGRQSACFGGAPPVLLHSESHIRPSSLF